MIKSAMVRRASALVVGLCLVLFLGSSAAAGDMIPLKGRFDGVGNNFSGNFTHLGSFTGVIDPTAFTAVWTAANGDTVTNQTIAFVLIQEVAPGVFIYEQSLVITGGTGRFANAVGFAEVVGLFDIVTSEFDGDLDGEISRPNSQ